MDDLEVFDWLIGEAVDNWKMVCWLERRKEEYIETERWKD